MAWAGLLWNSYKGDDKSGPKLRREWGRYDRVMNWMKAGLITLALVTLVVVVYALTVPSASGIPNPLG